VLRVCGQRVGERGRRVGSQPEVEQGHPAVVELVGPQVRGDRQWAWVGRAGGVRVDARQLGGETGHGGGPRVRVVAQRAGQQVGQFPRWGGYTRRRSPAQLVQLRARVTPEPSADPAGEHLQHGHGVAVHVGALAHGQPVSLFRRGVGGGEAAAGHGDAHRRVGGAGHRGDEPGAGQAEVGHLGDDPTRGGVEQDVGGLDVLVHVPAVVGVREPPRELHGDVEHACRRTRPVVEAAVIDPVTEAAARDVLGEHPRRAVEVADVVAAADVRVQAEIHPHPRLLEEQRPLRQGAEQLRTGALHREVGAPFQVPYPVHQPHPAVLVHPQHLVTPVDDLSDVPHPDRHPPPSARARPSVAP